MAALTEWEKNHVQAIDTLLRNCEIRNAEFNQKHMQLNQNPSEQSANAEDAEWLRFRSFTIDLYSVLDYICYLLFCHFQNYGKPDFSNRSRDVKFPNTFKLTRSSFPGQENPARQSRDKWKQEQTEIIFGHGVGDRDEPFLREQDKRVYDYFSAFVLKVQDIKDVDAAGNVIECNPEEGSEVESFSLLHFFRNYSAHRDFVRFYAEPGVLYIDMSVNYPFGGKRIFQPQSQEPPWGKGDAGHWRSLPITARGFWIEFPIVRPLLKVASQLLSFVKIFRANVVKDLTGVSYPHDVSWTWDDLIVDNTVTSWEDYQPVLNRPVL